MELRGSLGGGGGGRIAGGVCLTAVVELPDEATAVLRVPSPALLLGLGG